MPLSPFSWRNRILNLREPRRGFHMEHFETTVGGWSSRPADMEHMKIPSVLCWIAVAGAANQVAASKILSDRCTHQ